MLNYRLWWQQIRIRSSHDFCTFWKVCVTILPTNFPTNMVKYSQVGRSDTHTRNTQEHWWPGLSTTIFLRKPTLLSDWIVCSDCHLLLPQAVYSLPDLKQTMKILLLVNSLLLVTTQNTHTQTTVSLAASVKQWNMWKWGYLIKLTACFWQYS